MHAHKACGRVVAGRGAGGRGSTGWTTRGVSEHLVPWLEGVRVTRGISLQHHRNLQHHSRLL